MFFTLKLSRKQFQSTNHSVNAEKLLRLNTYHCKPFLFDFNDLKFKLQYEWTPPQMFFLGYCLLQQFCHIEKGAYDIKCSRILLELKSCWFLRLGFHFIRGIYRRCAIKKGALKIFAIFTGKHLCQGLFLSCNFMKKRNPGFPVNFARFLKHLLCRSPLDDYFYFFFYFTYWLYTLYFTIIYSWQLSSSEKSFLGGKNSFQQYHLIF